MTSAAMIAGMVPMAIGFGESGQQSSPLGRAAVGGLIAATLATLLILPAVFALLQNHRPTRSPTLNPDDPEEIVAVDLPTVLRIAGARVWVILGVAKSRQRTESAAGPTSDLP